MFTPQDSKSRISWIFIAPLIAVILLGLLGALYVYYIVDQGFKQSITDRVQIIATSLDESDIRALYGDERDLTNPIYLDLKRRLTEIHQISRDSRLVYLMGYQNGEVFFYMDSEDPSSEDYSPPGQVYDEASDVMLETFTKGQVGYELFGDRWGTWLSGFAPIIDPHTGEVLALVGIDVDVWYEYLPAIVVYTSLPILGMIVILLLLYVAYERSRAVQNRLDDRAELLAIASHEIRTPMTGILWVAKDLLNAKEEPLTLRQKTLMVGVYDSAIKILERINNLLTSTAFDRDKIELTVTNIPLQKLLEDAVGFLSLVAEQKKLAIRIDANLTSKHTIRGDEEKLRLAFNNILSNAVKYAYEGSIIDILFSEDKCATTITVSNTGDGILESDMPYIFSGFHRGRNVAGSSQGTGLGLYLTKKIIELHNGEISLTSQPHSKTVFTLRFPKE